ncbi:AAA family ATPase [Micromonospora tulbaghiae]|uniref:AAA family ATPase n=1 Tax=Micromonospora tulbaghiae TaxID=479978 RepID=A0AAW4JIQ2_9ACTN|nr:AAA family ATPase [Micromonospora tulbaghiae]MBO4141723.1 AAA family ATPase [Micromonospora tulbaghiae]
MVYVPEEPVFVGRDHELNTLRRRLSEAGQGTARTVLIGGEPGVGKSRLMAAFAREARERGAHVLAGACEEHFGDPMPYAPLLEALETFGREHGDPEAAELGGPAYRKLTAFFDLEGDSMHTPQQVFLAVRRMLDHIGAEAPVVLIMEDLHWADPSTLDLVRHLAQAPPDGRRLLFVCSYRANPRRGDPLWQLLAGTTFLRRTERFELPAFTLEEMRRLVAAGSPGRVDPRLVERCLRWSDGIPFYAEQLMAAGALAGRDEDVQLPPDIRSVMLARLGGLTEEALKVLRVAAVAGRAMSRRLLRTVSGLPAETLRDALQECFDQQMLVAGQEDSYSFRHALLREVVYQETVRDTQVDLHTAMAEALAADPRLSLIDGSAAAEQASHWYQAGAWPQALTYAVQAGRAAARTLAFSSAEVQFDRALRLWHRVGDPQARAGVPRSQLLAEAAEAARWSGRADRALELVEEAIDAPDHDGDPDRLGEMHERRATYLWEAGRRAESGEVFREAATLLADSRPSAVKARVLAGIALAHLQAGHYQEGRRTADEALTMATAVEDEAVRGRALNISGLALGMLGDPEGEVRLRRSIEIARSANHIEDLFRAYGNLGLVLEHTGRLRESAEVTMAALDEARRLDLAGTRQGAVLANNSSAALVLLGEWDDAEKIIIEVTLDRLPAESLYPRLTLAEIKVARGDLHRARELLTSIENVEHGEDPRFLGPLHGVRAELALAENNLARAADEVLRGVTAVRGAENALELLRLCAVGMRCAADRATVDPDGAAADGDRIALLASDARRQPANDEIDQLVLLCKAERLRIRGVDTATDWKRVARGWARLDRPYPAAYAHWRQASALAAADPKAAREPARNAYLAAKTLGATPLCERVRQLAAKIGLDLTDRPAPARRPFELTQAELDTLRLRYEGKDAVRIAHARGVAKRTVDKQLGRVYAKLGVHSAVEAIALARREGLFD